MSKFKNYKNGYTKSRTIHTIEDLVGMSLGEIAKREKELVSQYKQIGMPSKADMKNSSNVVYVHEYTRDDGTIVKAHWRSKGGQFHLSNSLQRVNNRINANISKVEKVVKDDILKMPSNMTLKEKVKEVLFTNPIMEKIFPMGVHAIEDGMHDLKRTRKNSKATVYESLDDLKDIKLRNKFMSLGVPKNAKGALYHVNSYESRKIANAPEIDNYIKAMIDNNGKPLVNQNMHFGVFNFEPWHIIDNFDRKSSLQNVTIYNPEITSNGKFKCKIIDYSDFKPSKYGELQFANDWGYKMQEKGLYKNYYVIFDIEKDIPKRYIKKLYKKY